LKISHACVNKTDKNKTSFLVEYSKKLEKKLKNKKMNNFYNFIFFIETVFFIFVAIYLIIKLCKN